MTGWPCGGVIVLCCAASVVAAKTPATTAAFGFGFDDTSLAGEMRGTHEAELRRLARLDGALRAALVESECCAMVDLRPVEREARQMDMRTCGGCDIDLARRVGARIAVTGWVQKVSNLILNINLVARDVSTGKVIEAGSVDIRGNTEESWSRGLAYLLRDRLHPSEWQGALVPARTER
jgi:hypothetical protein